MTHKQRIRQLELSAEVCRKAFAYFTLCGNQMTNKLYSHEKFMDFMEQGALCYRAALIYEESLERAKRRYYLYGWLVDLTCR